MSQNVDDSMAQLVLDGELEIPVAPTEIVSPALDAICDSLSTLSINSQTNNTQTRTILDSLNDNLFGIKTILSQQLAQFSQIQTALNTIATNTALSSNIVPAVSTVPSPLPAMQRPAPLMAFRKRPYDVPHSAPSAPKSSKSDRACLFCTDSHKPSQCSIRSRRARIQILKAKSVCETCLKDLPFHDHVSTCPRSLCTRCRAHGHSVLTCPRDSSLID